MNVSNKQPILLINCLLSPHVIRRWEVSSYFRRKTLQPDDLVVRFSVQCQMLIAKSNHGYQPECPILKKMSGWIYDDLGSWETNICCCFWSNFFQFCFSDRALPVTRSLLLSTHRLQRSQWLPWEISLLPGHGWQQILPTTTSTNP